MDELYKEVAKQNEAVCQKVEMLISRVYSVKDIRPRAQVWFTVAALETYKKQITLVTRLLTSGFVDEQSVKEYVEIRRDLADSLFTIQELVATLFKEGPDAQQA